MKTQFRIVVKSSQTLPDRKELEDALQEKVKEIIDDGLYFRQDYEKKWKGVEIEVEIEYPCHCGRGMKSSDQVECDACGKHRQITRTEFPAHDINVDKDRSLMSEF